MAVRAGDERRRLTGYDLRVKAERGRTCNYLVVKRDSFRLRCEVEFPPQDVLTDMKLAYCLVGCSHERVQAHEVTVGDLSRRVLQERLAKSICRIVVGTLTLKHLRRLKEQPETQFRQHVAALRTPALIAVFRQQLTAVCGERSLACLDVAAAYRVLGKLLELVCVDHDMLGVQDEHRVRQPEVGRIPAPRKLRLQRVPGGMESLTEAVERGLDVHTRPEDVGDLFAVHRVSRAGRPES